MSSDAIEAIAAIATLAIAALNIGLLVFTGRAANAAARAATVAHRNYIDSRRTFVYVEWQVDRGPSNDPSVFEDVTRDNRVLSVYGRLMEAVNVPTVLHGAKARLGAAMDDNGSWQVSGDAAGTLLYGDRLFYGFHIEESELFTRDADFSDVYEGDRIGVVELRCRISAEGDEDNVTEWSIVDDIVYDGSSDDQIKVAVRHVAPRRISSGESIAHRV